VIGSSGHGAGAYANVKLSNGGFLSGKRVAGFPDATEKEKDWAKNGTLLPFLVESKLRQNCATAINKLLVTDKHEVIDQRIVSTMFLPPAASVAKEMILLLEDKSIPTQTEPEGLNEVTCNN
jgi:hypothetical protein